MSEARDGSGSTSGGAMGSSSRPRSARARGSSEGAPIDLAGVRRKQGEARRGAAAAEGAHSEVRSTASLRREAFADDERTVRTEHPRALLDDARAGVHDEDTLVVHVSKILADADRALDALSHEISVVAPLPTAPATDAPAAPAAERPAASLAVERTPVDPPLAAAPVVPWPLADAPLAPSSHAAVSTAADCAPVVERAAAPPAPRRRHASPEAGSAALAPSLPASSWRSRALVLPGAIAIAAALVVARLQPAPAPAPHSAPLALQHVVTVENRGPRSAEPPRPQTLLEAFQQGPAAVPPRETEPVALVEAARRALAEGRPGDAHALASRAAQRDPYSPHGFAALAEAELALGAPERALEAALAAAKLRPKRVRYQHLLARVYGALGRTDDAREAQRLAELLAPSDPDVRAMERAAQRAQPR